MVEMTQSKVTNLHHFIFTPKYRQPLFENRTVAQECASLIRNIARLKGIQVAALAVQPDHVHVMCYLPATMTVSKAAMLMKWFSAFKLKQNFRALRQREHIWGHRYFATSVGGGKKVQEDYITRQIRR